MKLILFADGEVLHHASDAPTLRIGSDPTNDWVIHGPRNVGFRLSEWRGLVLAEPFYPGRNLISSMFVSCNGENMELPRVARPGDRFSLGDHWSIQVVLDYPRQAEFLASQPDTPLDLLLTLGARYPAAFFANPLLPLLSLGDPSWADKISAALLLPLLAARHGAPSDHWFWMLANHPDDTVRRAVASSPAPPEVLFTLAQRAERDAHSWRLRELLLRNPATPPALLESLSLRYWKQPPHPAAWNPALPEALARRLYLTQDPNTLGQLAKNPSLPLDLLEELVRSPDFSLRAHCTENPALPEELLARLAADTDILVRAPAADSRRLTAPIAAKLAADPSPEVRRALSYNPRTPPAILEQLASPLLRPGVILPPPSALEGFAENPSSPPELLARLAARRERGVAAALGRNPVLPFALAVSLIEQHQEAREAIARENQSPEILHALLDRLDPVEFAEGALSLSVEELLARDLPEALWMRLMQRLGRLS